MSVYGLWQYNRAGMSMLRRLRQRLLGHPIGVSISCYLFACCIYGFFVLIMPVPQPQANMGWNYLLVLNVPVSIVAGAYTWYKKKRG